MKIIFVDIDGVLNLNSTPCFTIQEGSWRRSYTGLDKNLLMRLREIVLKIDCKIVLTSTWRKNSQALEHFKKNLKKIGILSHYVGCTIDMNPTSVSARHRPAEIDDYLTRNKAEKYAIVDDVDLLLYDYGGNTLDLKNNFFKINEDTGITSVDVEKILNHLN